MKTCDVFLFNQAKLHSENRISCNLRAIRRKVQIKPGDTSGWQLASEGSPELLTSCTLTIFSLLPKMPNDEGVWKKNIFIYSLNASKHPECNLDRPSQTQTLETTGRMWEPNGAVLGCWRRWHWSRDTAHQDAAQSVFPHPPNDGTSKRWK